MIRILFLAATAALAATQIGPTADDLCKDNDGRTPAKDFGQFCVYHAANKQLRDGREKVRVVFLGDSITEGWKSADPTMFERGVIDRGISGQTTTQMLLRFREDVVDLHPQVVHIMAGTNDVAGNTGPMPIDRVLDNIRSMAELARANGIRVVIASVPPAAAFSWRPEVRPVAAIAEINRKLRAYAAANRFTYVDYFAALADQNGAMKPGMAHDGVHPTAAGYAAMKPLAIAAIR